MPRSLTDFFVFLFLICVDDHSRLPASPPVLNRLRFSPFRSTPSGMRTVFDKYARTTPGQLAGATPVAAVPVVPSARRSPSPPLSPSFLFLVSSKSFTFVGRIAILTEHDTDQRGYSWIKITFSDGLALPSVLSTIRSAFCSHVWSLNAGPSSTPFTPPSRLPGGGVPRPTVAEFLKAMRSLGCAVRSPTSEMVSGRLAWEGNPPLDFFSHGRGWGGGLGPPVPVPPSEKGSLVVPRVSGFLCSPVPLGTSVLFLLTAIILSPSWIQIHSVILIQLFPVLPHSATVCPPPH